jgi:hypothetical protein
MIKLTLVPQNAYLYSYSLVSVEVTNQIYTDSLGRKVNYTGQWENGVAEGYGKGHLFEEKDPSVITGKWKNGLATGQGEAVEDNGNTFSGMFKDGHKVGHGTMKYPNGKVYIGNL